MRIYVGNLSYDTTEDELRKDFSAFGEIASVSVVTDRYSGRSKGFAFVEMTNKAEADAAIAGMNGKAVKERTLVVNEARPRTEGGSSGGSRGGYGGGSGGYGGGGGGYGGGGYGGGGRDGGGRDGGGRGGYGGGGGYGDKRGGGGRDSGRGGRR
jgi:RNA recognition motif-containing protein